MRAWRVVFVSLMIVHMPPHCERQAMTNNRPNRLYKYRAFNNLTLDMLVSDNLFFADPSTFNDPLDTKPSVESDLDPQALEALVRRMVEQRVHAEMTANAQAIKYRGAKTIAHIDRLACTHADQLIAEVQYNSTNPDYENEEYALKSLFGDEIERELLRRYGKGIVSLAERANCPLMWSHYADQHKGLCVGYSIPDDGISGLHEVEYGGSRLIEASAIAAMLEGDTAAQRRVDAAFLTRKAPDWHYEREWRLIGDRGARSSPLELEEIIFGLRCARPVRFAVVSALQNRRRPVQFHEIYTHSNDFHLEAYPLDTAELLAHFPVRAREIFEHFQPIELPPHLVDA